MVLLLIVAMVVGVYLLVLLLSFISIPKKQMDLGDRVRLTLKAYGITMGFCLALLGLVFVIRLLTGPLS